MHADLVIRKAKVITVDRDFSISQAIAVKGDEIVAVGSNEAVEKCVGRQTRVLDLKGYPVLPGINDGHMHPTAWAASKPPYALSLRPPGVRSIKQIREAVREKAKSLKPGEWIRGRGWNPDFLEECQTENRFPTKDDLDDVSPDNPVVFLDWSGHNLWVNSKALELANVTKKTPDPPDGHIEKERTTDEPSGILKELPAFELIMKHVPLFLKDDFKALIIQAQQELNRNGITSYTEPLGPGADFNEAGLRGSRVIEAYRDLLGEGRITARVHIPLLFGKYGSVSYKDLVEGAQTYQTPEGLDPKWVRLPGIKIFADGIPPTKTAWMWEEYLTGGYGSLIVPGDTNEEKYRELKKMVSFSHEKGWQVAIHGCGDRAISAALDGIEEAIKDKPWFHLRHYIIHGDFVRAEDLRRAARYDVGMNMNPDILVAVTDTHVPILGPERSANEFPYRAALDAGVPLAFSSDAGVTYPNWRQGVQSAILRESVTTGRVNGPEQRISREEAIRAYTLGGAWQDHMEYVKGSIEVGKLADLCIISDDILSTEEHSIGGISVLMTIVGGSVVWDGSGDLFG
jgi:predicted amidohydrolase YtcJ